VQRKMAAGAMSHASCGYERQFQAQQREEHCVVVCLLCGVCWCCVCMSLLLRLLLPLAA
jgi:hypothetical protein